MSSKIQTKIQFPEKKRFSLCTGGKENCIKTTPKSPKKSIIKVDESDSEDELIISHFLGKRIFNSPNKNKDVGGSPPKRECTATPTQLMNHLTVKSLSKSPSPCKKQNSFSPKKLFAQDVGGSPPKRKCTATPTQPKDHLNVKSLSKSPSPSKKQNSFSPKKLFTQGSANKQINSVNEFHEAHKALHSSAPTSLPGREDKLIKLKEFLTKHLENETSGTLYVSGPPGTGKTACLNIAMSDPKVKRGFHVVYVNCTSMKSASAIYCRICEELGLKPKGRTEKCSLSAIEKHLSSTHRMILLVLDELDQLSSSKQSVLYTVFEWPSRPKSRLVLVGIANALDLTDRILPRLRAHLQLQPELLHFAPYSRQQIVDIITDRLTQAGVNEVFSAGALQLLAGKVAAVSGDVRRALDMARRVVELAENKNILQPINGDTKNTVALQEVMSVVSDVYNTAQCFDTSESETFPIQQKLLICSLLLMLQSSKAKDVTIGKLHDVYRKVCDKRNISSIDLSEFLSLTTLVSARGILRIVGKTHNRLSKVVLQWDEKEVAAALEDKQLLAAILNDKSCTVG